MVCISVYGHDRNSFISITRSSEKFYDNLVSNLRMLINNLSKVEFDLEISWRSYSHFNPQLKNPDSKLYSCVKSLESNGVPIHLYRGGYNNWGGLITEEDVKDLDIKINDGSYTYKKGPCSLLFFKMMVSAGGRVNACACRDARGTLHIGDLKKQKLKEIISTDNKRYTNLIQEQMKGHFPKICKNCDYYRSIYRKHNLYNNHEKPLISYRKFYQEY